MKEYYVLLKQRASVFFDLHKEKATATWVVKLLRPRIS
jgi:hypothetical protein